MTEGIVIVCIFLAIGIIVAVFGQHLIVWWFNLGIKIRRSLDRKHPEFRTVEKNEEEEIYRRFMKSPLNKSLMIAIRVGGVIFILFSLFMIYTLLRSH